MSVDRFDPVDYVSLIFWTTLSVFFDNLLHILNMIMSCMMNIDPS